MPIYNYRCSECDAVEEYLVDPGQTPDECRSCCAGIQDFVFFERIFHREVPAKGKFGNMPSMNSPLDDCPGCGFPYSGLLVVPMDGDCGRPDDN